MEVSSSSSPSSSSGPTSAVTSAATDDKKLLVMERNGGYAETTISSSSSSSASSASSSSSFSWLFSACWLSSKSRYMNSRAKPDQAYIPTDIEHLANVVTHGLWILPSVGGLWWMTTLSVNEVQRITAIIYGLSLFFLFTVSTTFHTLAYCGKFRELKNFFHIGDRAVIYVFIAASYTPWLTLKDFNGFSTAALFTVWIASMLGIVYQYTYHEQYKWLETLLYMVIGVTPSIIVLEMKDMSGLHELAFGGLIYMAGVVFFKCDGVIPFAHAIWHSFVFVGAIVHFFAVCTHLLGPRGDL